MFKPKKYPNDKIGESIDWKQRIKKPSEWLYSEKLNGVRGGADFRDMTMRSSSLTPIRSNEIQEWMYKLAQTSISDTVSVLEGEFYAEGLNLEEIKHFVNSEDVTTQKARKKYAKNLKKESGLVVI